MCVCILFYLFLTKGNFGDAASYLVEKGADANDVYVDETGDRHSLLMDAIIVENVPFAELLVKHGANVNVTDEQGVTTLIQVSRSVSRYLVSWDRRWAANVFEKTLCKRVRRRCVILDLTLDYFRICSSGKRCLQHINLCRYLCYSEVAD